MTATTDEEQAAFARSLAFNTEAVRGGLFAAAQDIAETMREQGVPHADAILLTAAAEFCAQLWAQVGIAAGVPAQKNRTTLLGEIRTFYQKHRHLGGQKATRQ